MHRWFPEGLIGAVVCLGFIQAAGLLPIEDNPDTVQWSFLDHAPFAADSKLPTPN